MNSDFWRSYRDELVATGLVLGLSVIGTLFITSRLQIGDVENIPEDSVESTDGETNVLGNKIEEAINTAMTPVPEKSPTIQPTATSTPGPLDTEVFYGIGGTYSFDEYELIINSPRLIFRLNESESRTFIVDIIIRNKSLESGLLNRIKASIVKDGNIIVPEAALSLSESRRIMVGEQLTFEARMSLIEGTDVREIFFKPEETDQYVEHGLMTEQ